MADDFSTSEHNSFSFVLGRIESKIEGVDSKIDTLQSDLITMRADVNRLRQDFDGHIIEAKLAIAERKGATVILTVVSVGVAGVAAAYGHTVYAELLKLFL